MKTRSYILAVQRIQLEHEIRSLEGQIAPLKSALQQCLIEDQDLENQFREAVREEHAIRESRRTPKPHPPMDHPNPIPHREWMRWRETLNRVSEKWNRHSAANLNAGKTTWRNWRLCGNLSNFAMNMLACSCFASWNPRNPDPYLP